MSITTRYVETPGCLLLVMEGLWTTEDAIHTLDDAKARAAAQGITRLLIDVRQLRMPADPFVRYETALHIVKLFQPPYRIAALANAKDITRFVENTAVNRGVSLQVFSDEDQAIWWLIKEVQPAHPGLLTKAMHH